MKDYYLEFEKPIQEIDSKILEFKSDESSDKKSSELSSLELARESTIKEIFSNLSRWDRVQLARHPQRPLSLDYINYVTDDFIELHGDRYFGDDKAVICGIGRIKDLKAVFIGQQKGKNT